MPFIQDKIEELLNKETQDLARSQKIYKTENYQSHLKIELVEIKFMPLKHNNRVNQKVKIEIVVKHTLVLPEYSSLNKLLAINQKFLTLNETKKISFIQTLLHGKKNNPLNKLSKKNKKFHYNDYNQHNIASIDLGQKNLLTMVFSHNEKGKIISGNQYNHDMKKMDHKIDTRKSVLSNDTIRRIQSNYQIAKNEYASQLVDYNILFNDPYITHEEKDKLIVPIKPKLSEQDFTLLKQYETNYREDKLLIKLQTHKNKYVNDVVHKMSHHIVTMCLDNNIGYLVIGKNDDWKKEVNNGKKNNRELYNFPHSELIEKIQYKMLKFGIAVLLTEESYTSKTSFMNNNELKSYNDNQTAIKLSKKTKIKALPKTNKLANFNIPINSDENVINNKTVTSNIKPEEFVQSVTTKTSQVKQISSNSNKFNYGGKRVSRDVFMNHIPNHVKKDKLKGIIKFVHSDINGAFNIMRKVFFHIAYNSKHHNFNYDILGYKLNKKKLYNLRYNVSPVGLTV